MPLDTLIDGMLDIIKLNLIAKSNLTSDVTTGDVLVDVDNAFRYEDGDEIILIDNNYNNANGTNSSHYKSYEYVIIDEVNNTNAVTLKSGALSDWLVTDSSMIQRTIAHNPLFENNVLYGDREVINDEQIVITLEPVSMSNEWMYLHGGLSEEYRVDIMVYGKNVDTENGMKILSKYSDAVYTLFLKNIHLSVEDYFAPLLENVTAGDTYVIVENTAQNREMFNPANDPYTFSYAAQDNVSASAFKELLSATENGSELILEFSYGFCNNFNASEFAAIRRVKRYVYDSRIDSIDYGQIQRGSAMLRAAKLSWFGKEIREFDFPQPSKAVQDFNEIDPSPYESSSSSSSSGP